MMLLSFDLAAVLLCIALIALYFIGRSYPSKTNRIYIVLVFLTLLSALFNFLTVFRGTSGEYVSVTFSYFTNILYLLSYNTLNIIFYVYIAIVTKRHASLADNLFALGALIAVYAMIIFSPLNGFVFTITPDGEYVRGVGMYVVYAIAIVVFLADFIVYFSHIRQLNRMQYLSVFILLTLVVVCVLLQFNIEGLYIAHFALAIAELFLYVNLQNPFIYISRRTLSYNVAAFYDTAEGAIYAKKPFSAVIFSPDEYDYINNVFGCAVVDSLAYSLSRLLAKKFGRRHVFNFDKCKFAIFSLYPDGDYDVMVKAVRTFFRAPVKVGANVFSLTPKLKVVSYPRFVNSVEDIRAAVEYTYGEGRNEAEDDLIIRSDAVQSRLREANILHILKRALVNGELEVYYQPIFDVHSGKFTIAEALLRLKNEEMGYISPDEFIAVAERNGLIIKIGEFVAESVCRFIAGGQADGLGLRTVEVNLSIVQCMQATLADNIIHIMQKYGITGDRVNFEVTETASHNNLDTLTQNMKKLIDYGSAFSVDDYGTGFSTVKYLVSLPVDMVKIDKSILWEAMRKPEAMTVLRHTVSMLKALRKSIVVEGIETEEMSRKVSDMDCDYLQGYLYSRPLPCDKFVEFLRGHNLKKD